MFITAIVLMLASCTHSGAERAQEIKAEFGESIYRLESSNGHGTGFVVKNNKGKNVIITNGHVCEGYRTMTAVAKNGDRITVRVIHESPLTDLCLLQAPKRSKALHIGNTPKKDQEAFIVGYPLGPFMVASVGRIKGYTRTSAKLDTRLELCRLPKHRIIEVEIPIRKEDGTIFKIKEKICTMQVKSYFTTIPADRGFSGSPLLNDDGEVIGVIMATQGNISWGTAVPLKELKKYLKLK